MFIIFTKLADFIVFYLFSLNPDEQFSKSLHFFIEDTTKIFFLLATVIYVVSILRSFFPPEKVKNYLSGKKEFIGNIFAAFLGVVTPFCSCSACPLFIGFVEAGIPLGVTFSFLISSPMVNEIALVMLLGVFGWKIAAIYMITGLTLAIVVGMIIGKLKLERYVQDYVWQTQVGHCNISNAVTWKDRHIYAKDYMTSVIKKTWIFIIIAIFIGSLIHGFVPQDYLGKIAGKDNIFAVPIAVLMGVPLYASCAGIIPLLPVLLAKGLPLGTMLAFTMSVTALSFPEMVILSQVLKKQLIFIFAGILTISIIFVGYLFNFIM